MFKVDIHLPEFSSINTMNAIYEYTLKFLETSSVPKVSRPQLVSIQNLFFEAVSCDDALPRCINGRPIQ